MAVTTIGKPAADFVATFTLANRSTAHVIPYGITPDGKIYRNRVSHDAVGGPGGLGTYVDTGVTIPDITTLTDL